MDFKYWILHLKEKKLLCLFQITIQSKKGARVINQLAIRTNCCTFIHGNPSNFIVMFELLLYIRVLGQYGMLGMGV